MKLYISLGSDACGADLPNRFCSFGDVGGREVDHGEGCAHRATHGRSIDLQFLLMLVCTQPVTFPINSVCVCSTQRSSWDFISSPCLPHFSPGGMTFPINSVRLCEEEAAIRRRRQQGWWLPDFSNPRLLF
jgi:hypothetical protein